MRTTSLAALAPIASRPAPRRASHPRSHPRPHLPPVLGIALAGLIAAGCGRPYNQSQDAGAADLKPRPGADLKTGGPVDLAQSTGPDQKADCAESERTCPRSFSYPDDGSIAGGEVRGDFCAGCWAAGTPLTLSGGSWVGEVKLPWSKRVAYKLYFKLKAGGESWRIDPSNPNQIDDGFGGKNSVIEPLLCMPYQCP